MLWNYESRTESNEKRLPIYNPHDELTRYSSQISSLKALVEIKSSLNSQLTYQHSIFSHCKPAHKVAMFGQACSHPDGHIKLGSQLSLKAILCPCYTVVRNRARCRSRLEHEVISYTMCLWECLECYTCSRGSLIHRGFLHDFL